MLTALFLIAVLLPLWVTFFFFFGSLSSFIYIYIYLVQPNILAIYLIQCQMMTQNLIL